MTILDKDKGAEGVNKGKGMSHDFACVVAASQCSHRQDGQDLSEEVTSVNRAHVDEPSLMLWGHWSGKPGASRFWGRNELELEMFAG